MFFPCDWLNYVTDVFYYIRSYPNIVDIRKYLNVCCKIMKCSRIGLTLQSSESDVFVSSLWEDVV